MSETPFEMYMFGALVSKDPYGLEKGNKLLVSWKVNGGKASVVAKSRRKRCLV